MKVSSSLNLNYEWLQEEIRRLDELKIDAYNSKKKVGSKYILHKEIGPCPYEGDIEQARIVLLLANPSYSPNRNDGESFSLETDHKRNELQRDWGIFSLQDNSNDAMRNWWRENLKQLKEESGLSWQQVSNRIAALQINAWASEQFDESCKLDSFEIMRSIAHEFAKRDVIFVVCRRFKQWTEILGKNDMYRLNSYRRAYITKKNLDKCPNAYEQILKKLTD